MADEKVATAPTPTPLPPPIPKDILPQGYVFRFDKWCGDIWRMFHSTTFLYPEQNPTEANKTLIRQFIAILPFLLPCSSCGVNFLKEIESMPLTDKVLSSRDALTRWGVDLHNSVNTRLKKATIPYDEVYRYFLLDATVDPRDKHGGGGLLRSLGGGGQISCSSGVVITVLVLLVVMTLISIVLAVVLVRRRRTGA